VVVANTISGDVTVLGNGDGSFQTARQFVVGDSPRSVIVADLNGDGIPDIVTANRFSGDVSVLFGNGDGTFQPQQRFAAEFALFAAAADLNGDGAVDLAVGAPGRVIILLHK